MLSRCTNNYKTQKLTWRLQSISTSLSITKNLPILIMIVIVSKSKNRVSTKIITLRRVFSVKKINKTWDHLESAILLSNKQPMNIKSNLPCSKVFKFKIQQNKEDSPLQLEQEEFSRMWFSTTATPITPVSPIISSVILKISSNCSQTPRF